MGRFSYDWRRRLSIDPDRFPFRGDKPQTHGASPVYGAYERAKESASQMIAGQGELAARGTQARLSASGTSGIPGIQTAVSMPHRYRATEQLGQVSASLDIEKEKALRQDKKLNFAIEQWREEKDDARKARWSSIIAKIVGAGIGFAINGPPGAVAGAGVSMPAGDYLADSFPLYA